MTEETGFANWTLDRLTAQRDHLRSILLVSVGQSDRPQIREEYDAVCAEIAKRTEERPAMTETTRIWWGSGDGASLIGRVGTLEENAFLIVPPGIASEWALLSSLPGIDRKRGHADDPDTLKAEAERWLEEFVSSLGAIFPQPCPTEAVFSDGRVPCTLSRNHAEPHEFGDTVLPFASDIPGTTAAMAAREKE